MSKFVKMEKVENELAKKTMSMEEEAKTVFLDMDKLRPNNRNSYEMSEIENLSGMIELAGAILQNIIVMPADEDGYYTITTGERRWRAAQLLRERGKYPAKYNNKVPCTIRSIEDINLPLSRENKEDFSILVTNQYRKKSDSELLMEMQKWRNIFAELRAAGVESVQAGWIQGTTEDEGGNVKIAGVPTRQLIANQLGVSTGQVSRLENVEKNGSEVLLEMLMNDKMELGAAEQLVQAPTEEQEEVLQELAEESTKITKKAVSKKLEARVEKISIKREQIDNDFRTIISDLGDEVMISEEDYKKVLKLLKKIKALMS